MTTRTTLTLRGQRNQCPGCGELFNSNYAFDMHRTGEHKDNGRRCLTPAQMAAAGMVKLGGGLWWASRLREEKAHEGDA